MLEAGNLVSATGILKYEYYPEHGSKGYRVTVELDNDFGKLYRNLLPKHLVVQPPKYNPHITAVRVKIDEPSDLSTWGVNEGTAINFEYRPLVCDDNLYYWITCYSQELVAIRQRLGLPPRRNPDYTGNEPFHITIGNQKHLGKVTNQNW